jgi:predicted ABC-type ATPase
LFPHFPDEVKEGGHNIPEETIERRYKLGLENLFKRFIPIVDYWMIFDNSINPSTFISEGSFNEENKIYSEQTWHKLNTIAHG